MYRIRQEELPLRGSSHNFVGADNGDVGISVFLLLAIGGCAIRARHAMDDQRSSYIVRLGVDTIMAESFSASLGRIEGDIVDRSPTTSLLHYELILDNRGRIAQAHATQHAATG